MAPNPSRKGKRPKASGKTESKRGSTRTPKFVYSFGSGHADGTKEMNNLLGGKGANLAEMCNLGLPVPDGFTISTDVCTWVLEHAEKYPAGLKKSVEEALTKVERAMGKTFGDPDNPLLVSVRSGARASMPGMMDTVLNLGLNDVTVEGLAKCSGNPRFAWDSYRRFVQMYGDVVLDVKKLDRRRDPFERAFEAKKEKRGITRDTDLTADDLRELVHEFKAIVKRATGRPFPDDPFDQLWGAIGAVFGSWNNDRAIAYRQMHSIPSEWGTAVTVMAMVFGNMGEDSGTGVAFTRDPATGEKKFYGEYLMNAQGEDVVAGIRTPGPIAGLAKSCPAAWKELQRIQKLLETHYRDMQDLEFTIEGKKLYMLQCRAGKRTGFAAVRIATDMVKEKRITRDEALLRVDPESLNQLLQPVFSEKELKAARKADRVLTVGLNAGPGAAAGHIVFCAERAVERAAKGQTVILARIETSPEDIRGMQASAGILTARGGMTSHAALVARQMGKICVAGAGDLVIDYKKRKMRVAGKIIKEGDWISLDGTTGEVIAGELSTQPSEVLRIMFAKRRPKKASPIVAAFEQLMSWADDRRVLKVRANADQPDQARNALVLGAEGIGLCRTEHMFFEGQKLTAMRKMILAGSLEERELALKELLPLQRKDFEGLFKTMGSLPITIRTLDPPLHEFLPHEASAIKALAREMKVPASRLNEKVEFLSEVNPMLGHRGCRLGITYPEVTRMQARAIFEAACNVAKRTKIIPTVEVMIPLIGTLREFELQAAEVRTVAEEVLAKKKIKLRYSIGTMIELPRAALTADEIARSAEFFSFGTNDLTQTTFGISRDDSGHFIPAYLAEDIYSVDPFVTIDRQGVGRLMRIATSEGRSTRPGIKLGICGEHGGDPNSVEFCHNLGLEYVSCSPFRVPVARLAAAQAVITEKLEASRPIAKDRLAA